MQICCYIFVCLECKGIDIKDKRDKINFQILKSLIKMFRSFVFRALIAFMFTLLTCVFLSVSIGLPFYVGALVAIVTLFVRVPEGALFSSFAATLTQGYRSSYQGRLDKNELRTSNYGALQLFKDQTASGTGIIDSETMALIKSSFGNTVQMPVINYQDVTISNIRTCAIQTGGPTSALVSVTFVTYSFGFAMYPAQFYNNDLKYQEVYNRNMRAYELKLAAALDTAGVAKLEADKNQYFPAALTGSYYAATGNALRVPVASQADFFNQSVAILETMDFAGSNINDLTNPKGMAQIRTWANQGEGNSTNTAFQFGGQTFYSSNRVTNGAGVLSTHYLVADDSLAIVSRLDPDVLAGSVVGGGQKTWSTEFLPLIGMDFGLYYNEDCTNAAAIQSAGTEGLTRTKVESFEYSADIAYITAYNSAPTTNYSPIVKVELLTT